MQNEPCYDLDGKIGFTTDTEEEQLRLLATDEMLVKRPLIDELPMALECRVKSFENGILVGEIVNVNAEESILTDGQIDPKKLKPISYDPVNNTYLSMGDKVGNAFKDGLALK